MKQLPALSAIGTNRRSYYFARLLIIGFILILVLILTAPWQQFVTGSGKVIAFDPLERRVNVEAMVSGRVKTLHVVEGQRVKEGDLLVEIQDNDPNLLQNLATQRAALDSKLTFGRSRLDALNAQIEQQKLGKAQALSAGREKVAAAKIAAETAELNFERVSSLFSKGLESLRNNELAIMSRDSTSASYRSAQANLAEIENKFESTIASIRASQESTRSDMATAEKDLNSLDSSLSQNQRQLIEAPRDGFVLSVSVTDGSYLKPGSQICVIIPETENRYVEIWVDGNDVALIKARQEHEDGTVTPGSPVRLAFEGWPSLQAVGWPQLAINTFGGEVEFIDSTDDGKGRFRVVVRPQYDLVDRKDGQGKVEVPWPSGEKWLRQGVLTKAWVMLDEVPLWMELWRQINGFPPIGEGVDMESLKKKK